MIHNFDRELLPPPLGYVLEVFGYFYLLLGTIDGQMIMQILGGIAVALSIIDKGISVWRKVSRKDKEDNNK